jgi:hypothetical protein
MGLQKERLHRRDAESAESTEGNRIQNPESRIKPTSFFILDSGS